MKYYVMHRDGCHEDDLPMERFSELLDELAETDVEHPDVAVIHESGWSVSVYRSGFVIFQNAPERSQEVHFGPLSRENILALMVAVADGRISDVRGAYDWRPGHNWSAPSS